jgi:alkanesulfonate monooxygenase SsuD/methylene tetrahydromethanopterin reductase-like flavin-dependent oxidoreductase (luciferase family)
MRRYLTAMDRAPMFANEGDHEYAKIIAALGPKMLELGATLADGVHTYLVTPEHTQIARKAVADKFVWVERAVVLGENREVFLERAHTYLEHYTGLENYRSS